ncbi:putative nucleoside triphosphate pyrophosphatase Maf-like protein [Helianthus debilis subsp. tardiflorus]
MLIAVDFMSYLRENFYFSKPDDASRIRSGATDIDEMSIMREKPEDLVLALAEAKVHSYLSMIMREKPEDLVLALAEAKADAIVSWPGIQDHKEENAHPGKCTPRI